MALADFFQKRELRQMSMPSAIKWILCIVGAVVISGEATLVTESLITNCCPDKKTPGDLVMNWLLTDLGPEKLKLGYRALVIFGVDFFLYFGLILVLLALYKRRLAKNK
jgi:hypothetical protein